MAVVSSVKPFGVTYSAAEAIQSTMFGVSSCWYIHTLPSLAASLAAWACQFYLLFIHLWFLFLLPLLYIDLGWILSGLCLCLYGSHRVVRLVDR